MPKRNDSPSGSLLQQLRKGIIAGDFAPASKLNELKLAEKFRVSRTPLREALRALESEGFIRSEHNRGFWIASLDSQEVRDLYPIISSLEVLALTDGGLFAKMSIPELREINETFLQKKKQPLQAAALDEQFHKELTRHTRNGRLLEMISSLKLRIQRYESLYMADTALIQISYGQHLRILDELAQGAIDAASRALEENWRFGMEALLRSTFSASDSPLSRPRSHP
jgi:DNA-binding GntR family transcriptional regulator